MKLFIMKSIIFNTLKIFIVIFFCVPLSGNAQKEEANKKASCNLIVYEGHLFIESKIKGIKETVLFFFDTGTSGSGDILLSSDLAHKLNIFTDSFAVAKISFLAGDIDFKNVDCNFLYDFRAHVDKVEEWHKSLFENKIYYVLINPYL